MAGRFPPINARFPHLLHGGDYNPDQWPEAIWQEDMRLMKLAHCNSASVGIFAWVKSEPAEGQFEFGRLAHQAGLKRVMETELPPGVNVQMRTDGKRDFVFLMNFSAESQTVALDSSDYIDKLGGSPVSEPVILGPYGVRVLERAAR